MLRTITNFQKDSVLLHSRPVKRAAGSISDGERPAKKPKDYSIPSLEKFLTRQEHPVASKSSQNIPFLDAKFDVEKIARRNELLWKRYHNDHLKACSCYVFVHWQRVASEFWESSSWQLSVSSRRRCMAGVIEEKHFSSFQHSQHVSLLWLSAKSHSASIVCQKHWKLQDLKLNSASKEHY